MSGRRYKIPAIAVTLIVLTGAIMSCTVTTSPRDATESNEVSRVTPEATATPETAQPEPDQSPEPTPSPTPVLPEPTSTPQPTAEPVPDPTPEPTPESTPEPTEPPYPVACAFEEPAVDDDLQELVEEVLGTQASSFGVVIQELGSGIRAEINPDQSFYGASLYKTGVMYEVFRQIDEGEISLDQYVTIDDFYAAQDLGTLGLLGWRPGTRITIEQALEAAITISDNSSAYLLGDLVGWERMAETLHDLGAIDTRFSIAELPTTSTDKAQILQAIACADGVSRESSQLMLDLLAGQTVVDRLPRDLPTGTVVAHKTGNWGDANHDTGIVYGPEAVYVISVLSANPPGGDEIIARLSTAVYEYFHPADDEDLSAENN